MNLGIPLPDPVAIAVRIDAQGPAVAYQTAHLSALMGNFMAEVQHAVNNTTVPLLPADQVIISRAEHLVGKKALRMPVARLLTVLLYVAMCFRTTEAKHADQQVWELETDVSAEDVRSTDEVLNIAPQQLRH